MTHLLAREYRPTDFLSIEPSHYEIEGRGNQDIGTVAAIHGLPQNQAYTVVDPDGEIVLCCGIDKMWDGVGQAWILVSRLAEKYLESSPMARDLLMVTMNTYEYKRIQAVVDPRWETSVNFVRRLGFVKEATMKKYGPNGMDMDMYAIVKD